MKRAPWLIRLLAAVVFAAGVPAHLAAQENSGGSGGGSGGSGATTGVGPPPLSFEEWVREFRAEAIAAGIHAPTYDAAMKGVEPNEKVVERNQFQPEFDKPVWWYLDRLVTEERIADGKAKLEEHKALLKKIEAKHGVPAEVITAIWGVETKYGSRMGSFYVVEALATLAWRGRRTKFGRQQLIAALEILQKGDTTREALTGSWAGAMGHTQFIPTTYKAYAVDWDGDGKRDVWNNLGDAFATTANYLKASKWESGAPWGYEVVLPKSIDFTETGRGVRKPVSDWGALGVRLPGGKNLPAADRDRQASVIVPAGHRGMAFMVFRNFRAILRYNNSTSYALAVGHLSDRIAGGAPFKGEWPRDQKQLSRVEKEELQRLLLARGHDPNGVDGIIGTGTRKAIRAFQTEINVKADGHPTGELLDKLRELAKASE